MECTVEIDVICKYGGNCPDSYTTRCHACKNNLLSKFLKLNKET